MVSSIRNVHNAEYNWFRTNSPLTGVCFGCFSTLLDCIRGTKHLDNVKCTFFLSLAHALSSTLRRLWVGLKIYNQVRCPHLSHLAVSQTSSLASLYTYSSYSPLQSKEVFYFFFLIAHTAANSGFIWPDLLTPNMHMSTHLAQCQIFGCHPILTTGLILTYLLETL